jgi:hypothetical protein
MYVPVIWKSISGKDFVAGTGITHSSRDIGSNMYADTLDRYYLFKWLGAVLSRNMYYFVMSDPF